MNNSFPQNLMSLKSIDLQMMNLLSSDVMGFGKNTSRTLNLLLLEFGMKRNQEMMELRS